MRPPTPKPDPSNPHRGPQTLNPSLSLCVSLSLTLSLSLTHTHTHTHTEALKHSHTFSHAHSLSPSRSLSSAGKQRHKAARQATQRKRSATLNSSKSRTSSACRCRANLAHIRQTRPDSGLCSQVYVPKPFKIVLFLLGGGMYVSGRAASAQKKRSATLNSSKLRTYSACRCRINRDILKGGNGPFYLV